jgi:hypothetical protein
MVTRLRHGKCCPEEKMLAESLWLPKDARKQRYSEFKTLNL